ncbi:MAG TPA: nucleoside monophosphate kinase [Candidatus Saccharimonadales bacterium]|nr:nucleoside monophosphate kinase [Candidatus Saccharimonadales bacterium]
MIIILGTPGAGKTTQSRLLAEHLNCRCFSMGELIRNEVTGQERKDMLAGKIISDRATIGIIDKTLAGFDTSKEECVFEGNPRSISQAQWWLEQVREGRFKILGVIHLTAQLSIAKKRMLKRGRLDDHDDNVIETRFEEYQRSITPTLDFLKQNGVAVHEVSADGSIEEIAGSIREALGIA